MRAEGVNLVLDCVVDRISTADADAVLVEGVHVSEHTFAPRQSFFYIVPSLTITDAGL